MRRIRSAIAACAAISLTAVAACSPEAEQPPVPVEPSPQPAPAPATVPAIGYACESGQTVEVQYPDTATAQLKYKGQTYVLRATPSPTGARYAGPGVEWVTANTDGQESAVLSRLGPNDAIGIAVLERCSRPSSGVTPTGPTPAPAPGSGGMVPAVAACRGPQLKLSNDGGDAGAGNRVAIIGVQNIGAQPCSLTGYPTVTLQDARGRNLTTVRSEQTGDNYFRRGSPTTAVTLASQAKAFFDIAWNVVPHEGVGETVCPSAARVRAIAPGDTSPTTLAMTFTPCGSRIRVSPFRSVAEPVETSAT